MKNLFAIGLLRFFSLLPLPVNHALGALIGWLCWIFPTRLKQHTLLNLEACLPEYNLQQRRRLAKQSLMETGKSLTELGPLWYWNATRLLKYIKTLSPDILGQAQAKQKGIIVLTPHLGSWEMAGLEVATRIPLTSLYRPPRLSALNTLSVSARERTGAKLVPTNTRGVKALFKALAQQQGIGVLPDQDAGKTGSVFAPFFDVTASTVSLVSRLIKKTGAQTILVYAERLPYGHGYILHMHQPSDDIYNDDLVISATAMNQAIEDCIRNNPAQYQWSYKRFKTQPDDAVNIYDKGKQQ